MDNEKKRRIVIITAVILGILGLTYLGGMIGQFMDHYKTWLEAGGVGGNTEMKSVNFSPLACIPQAFIYTADLIKKLKKNWLLQKHRLNMSEANHPLKCIFRNGLKNGCLRKNI